MSGAPEQRDWTVGKEPTANNRERLRMIRARQRAIGRELRRAFDEVAQEPVPDEFMDLLRQIDEKQPSEPKNGKKIS
ncbi:MAG TPA: NepR family anti-sigma factor [Rhizomicrobium sp.]|nr:NepR family anti-sigma factor [Rhizomicrobium sp.]